MKKCFIALITDSSFIGSQESSSRFDSVLLDDALLSKELEKYDVKTIRVDWANPNFTWSQVDAAVFRTPWNYYKEIDKFTEWMKETEKIIPLYNPAELIRWNLNKKYLLDLESQGVTIPKSVIRKVGEPANLLQFLDENNYDGGIVKPTISGAAWNTHQYSRANIFEIEKITNELLTDREMLIQPFQNSIYTEGEISMMFFGCKYSHAVKKTPKMGDFRVQSEFGGNVHLHKASNEEIEFAQCAVNTCFIPPVYARVDVIRDNAHKLSLMELELIEPELFFRFSPASVVLFAKELIQLLPLK